MRQNSKSIVFNLLILCLGILLSADYFQSTVLASPITGTPSGKQGAGGPDTSDYPPDKDLESDFVNPSGPFVFFSGIGDSQKPYEFANSLNNGAVILRGAFPKGYVSRGGVTKKPLRSTQWLQDFFDRASGVFADKAVKAGKRVYFVGRFDDENAIRPCSVWSRIELPTLAAAGVEITHVDYSNFEKKKSYAVPKDLDPAPIITPREANGGLVKRQDYCFDWQGDREDPADPDSDPQVGLGYYPGNCGVHLQQVKTQHTLFLPPPLALTHSLQYQKNEGKAAANGVGNGGTSNYRFTIQLQDDQHEIIGGVDYYDAPGGQGVGVDSALPLVFIATAGNVDHDPVSFAYGSQKWKSSDSQCRVGRYDSGSRQMDLRLQLLVDDIDIYPRINERDEPLCLWVAERWIHAFKSIFEFLP
ncbi:MAG: hypothetical protein LQ350_004129 [Teloschistes chrysophthalmus]|nr:MAG: hypothetical protein LQ350_004129 [Niorma chrysophthalma]